MSRFSNDLSAVENSLTMAITWDLFQVSTASLVPSSCSCSIGWLALVRRGGSALVQTPVSQRVAPRASDASYCGSASEEEMVGAIQQAIAGHAIVKAYNLEEHAARDFLVRDASSSPAACG